jgi:uncharacterized protein (TIGR01244 family)
MDKSQLSEIYNYRSVDEHVSASGQPTEEQLAAVAQAGYSAVINLALHDDPRYALKDEAGTVQSLGMQYVHIPVQFAAPQEKDLLAFFTAMEQLQGGKVLVHCAANMRVSVFLGLYRAIRQGQPVEQAFELMNSIWQPDAVWSAFMGAMLAKYRR